MLPGIPPLGGGAQLSPASSKFVTQLLEDWRAGDDEALRAVISLVYDELRRVAHHYLRNERPDHTLQSAALVHEAYLRLEGNVQRSSRTAPICWPSAPN